MLKKKFGSIKFHHSWHRRKTFSVCGGGGGGGVISCPDRRVGSLINYLCHFSSFFIRHACKQDFKKILANSKFHDQDSLLSLLFNSLVYMRELGLLV